MERNRQGDAIRMKRAELASGVGAGVLGLGLGVLLSAYLRPYAAAILVVGALLHGWGMWDRHRMERSAAAPAPVWWDAALYWVCWAAGETPAAAAGADSAAQLAAQSRAGAPAGGGGSGGASQEVLAVSGPHRQAYHAATAGTRQFRLMRVGRLKRLW